MLNLIDFNNRFKSEQDCIDYLAQARWNGNPVCPHCESDNAYKIETRSIFKCRKCRKQFTVRIGTIFEESRLPLQKWFLAVFLLTSLKKGISSVQLAKYLGVTQKTAWFMLQRIRYAVNNKNFDKPLKNTVEADETFIGGKKPKHIKGRGVVGKQPVFGAVERKGRLFNKVIPDTDAYTLVNIIRDNVSKSARLITDNWKGYKNVTWSGYEHKTINHSKGVYAQGDIYTNTIEGYWSHLKKGLHAIYISVSKKHLQRYCDEYTYRYNTRTLHDGERFNDWFTWCGGRMTYSQLIQ